MAIDSMVDPGTMFSVEKIVGDFKGAKSLSDTYDRVLNHQGIKYFNALGYSDIEFVDCSRHHLIDQKGERYLDFVAGFAICHWGRKHPVLIQAIEQAAGCSYPNLLQLGVPTLPTILADQLISYLNGDFQRVFFTNSGAETTEYAMKMAINLTGREKLVYFTGDYHGLTLGALGVNGVTKQQKKFYVHGRHLQVPFNDAQAVNDVFRQHASDIAGVIIEPVQARAGLVADDEFLRVIRELCDQHGAVLIFDEIKTGFGRTGKDFFYQHSGVVPDIMMLAKGLSGGICPVGALVYKESVYRTVFNDVERLAVYSSTFRENNIAMAVGLAVMHLMRHESCLQNVVAAEALIRDRLDGAMLANGDEIIVRGKGLQLSVTLRGKKRTMVQSLIDAVEKDFFYMACCKKLLCDKKIVAMIPNRFAAAIAVVPALNIPLDHVTGFCDELYSVFDEMTSRSGIALLRETYQEARALLT